MNILNLSDRFGMVVAIMNYDSFAFMAMGVKRDDRIYI